MSIFLPPAGANIIDRATGALITNADGKTYYDLSADSGLGGNQYGPNIGDAINTGGKTLAELNAGKNATPTTDVFGNKIGDQAGTIANAQAQATALGATQYNTGNGFTSPSATTNAPQINNVGAQTQALQGQSNPEVPSLPSLGASTAPTAQSTSFGSAPVNPASTNTPTNTSAASAPTSSSPTQGGQPAGFQNNGIGVAPTTPTAPTTPNLPGFTAPITPTLANGADAFLQNYLKTLAPTSQETGYQSQLAQLADQSRMLGLGQQQTNNALDSQPIAHPFITGQQTAVAKDYALSNQTNQAQQQTVTQQLALEQAKRQSSIDVNKASLDYASNKDQQQNQLALQQYQMAFQQAQSQQQQAYNAAQEQYKLQYGQYSQDLQNNFNAQQQQQANQFTAQQQALQQQFTASQNTYNNQYGTYQQNLNNQFTAGQQANQNQFTAGQNAASNATDLAKSQQSIQANSALQAQQDAAALARQQAQLQTQQQAPTTLSPGDVRVDSSGKTIASNPTAAVQAAQTTTGNPGTKTPTPQELVDAYKANGNKPLTPDQLAKLYGTTAPTGATTSSGKLDTSVVEVGGRKVLIDNQTGKTIQDLGSATGSGGSSGTQAEKAATFLNQVAATFVPGAKMSNGIPTLDSSGFITPEAWKSAINSLPAGVTRDTFIKQFGNKILNQGGTVSANYGLTPVEIKLITG